MNKTIGIDARLWNETGIGRYIRNLVRGLDNKKYDDLNFLIYLKREEYDSVNFKVKHLNKRLLDIPWHSLHEQVMIPNILYKEDIDLMHFPYFSVPMFYKKPFIVTIHDLIIDHFSTGRASSLPFLAHKTKRLGYKLIMKRAISRAEKIITPSMATLDEIVDHYNIARSKIEVIPEASDPSINSSLKKSKHDKYFLYVGNVYPHKNVERLLEAFKSLNRNLPDVNLIFVGKEDFFLNRLKKHVRKKRIENIKFLGYVNDLELANLYKFSIALVTPSLMEGFGLSVLEALSQGTIVVASRIPSFIEVGGDTPYYFDPENTHDIEKTLMEVAQLSEKDRLIKIKQGKVRAGRFSWEKMVAKTVNVYKEIIK